MAVAVPKARPRLSRDAVADLLRKSGVKSGAALLGERGYYKNTLGDPGRNDRGIYDDAIFLLSDNAFASFNANTDPSVSRPGIAVLQPGLWRYRLGTHHPALPANDPRRYQALIQADDVTILRDGAKHPESGDFGIHIHHGAFNTTSSLGCQTIYPDQWTAFIEMVKTELRRAGQIILPYLLIANET